MMSIHENIIKLGIEANKIEIENVAEGSYFLSEGGMFYRMVQRKEVDADNNLLSAVVYMWPPEADPEAILATGSAHKERFVKVDRGQKVYLWRVAPPSLGDVEPEENNAETTYEPIEEEDAAQTSASPSGPFDMVGLADELVAPVMEAPFATDADEPDIIEQIGAEVDAEEKTEPKMWVYEVARELDMTATDLGELAVEVGIVPADTKRPWMKKITSVEVTQLREAAKAAEDQGLLSVEPEMGIIEPPEDEPSIPETLTQEEVEAQLGTRPELISVKLIAEMGTVQVTPSQLHRLDEISRRILEELKNE